MNSDIAAFLMGLAAVLLLIGYRLLKKSRREQERKMLMSEFLSEKEQADE